MVSVDNELRRLIAVKCYVLIMITIRITDFANTVGSILFLFRNPTAKESSIECVRPDCVIYYVINVSNVCYYGANVRTGICFLM